MGLRCCFTSHFRSISNMQKFLYSWACTHCTPEQVCPLTPASPKHAFLHGLKACSIHHHRRPRPSECAKVRRVPHLRSLRGVPPGVAMEAVGDTTSWEVSHLSCLRRAQRAAHASCPSPWSILNSCMHALALILWCILKRYGIDSSHCWLYVRFYVPEEWSRWF